MDASETDYLVVGAGAMGMAFVDTMLHETTATVTLVDEGHQPGGHWHSAYPFVRLHQPSAYYGVNSRAFGDDVVDTGGWNEGFFELASGHEVCAYYDQLLRHQLLPTGRLTYLPTTRHLGGNRFRGLDGSEHTVTIRHRLVDATYLRTVVPAMRPPPFSVDDGVTVVPPNGLPRHAAGHDRFTIVGAGKTGMDSCLWLLRNGIPPDRLRWIMPRDSWLMNRANVQPGARFAASTRAALGAQLRAAFEATSRADLFTRLEADGILLRIDPAVEPSMYHCAIASLTELDHLRSIVDVVRRGHVRHVGGDRLRLDGGDVDAVPGTLYVDCTAAGLTRRPPVPVFADDRITLQSIRGCQQVFSSALIAHVEHAASDDHRRNDVCRPVPHPDVPADWLRVAMADHDAQVRWLADDDLAAWLESSRLNLLRGMFAELPTEPTARAEAVGVMAATVGAGNARLAEFLTESPGNDEHRP